VALTGLSYPLIEELRNGQVNTMILFLASAFLVTLIRGSNITAGICLGLVGMIKPQPLIIIPYLFAVSRIRCGLAAAVTFTVGTVSTVSVIGWNSFYYYLKEVLPTFSMVKTSFPPILIYAPTNQSIQGVINRLFQSTRYSQAMIDFPGAVPILCRSATVLILGFTAFVILRHRREASSKYYLLRDCAWLLVTSVLLSPITWDHHLVILAIAGTVVWVRVVNARSAGFTDLVLMGAWILMSLPLFPFSELWKINRFTALGISLKGFAIMVFWFGFYVRHYLQNGVSGLNDSSTSPS